MWRMIGGASPERSVADWSDLSPDAWSRRAVAEFGADGATELVKDNGIESWQRDVNRWPWACREAEVGMRCFVRDERTSTWTVRLLLAAHPGRRFQFLMVDPEGVCELSDLAPGVFDVVWCGPYDEVPQTTFRWKTCRTSTWCPGPTTGTTSWTGASRKWPACAWSADSEAPRRRRR